MTALPSYKRHHNPIIWSVCMTHNLYASARMENTGTLQRLRHKKIMKLSAALVSAVGW